MKRKRFGWAVLLSMCLYLYINLTTSLPTNVVPMLLRGNFVNAQSPTVQPTVVKTPSSTPIGRSVPAVSATPSPAPKNVDSALPKSDNNIDSKTVSDRKASQLTPAKIIEIYKINDNENNKSNRIHEAAINDTIAVDVAEFQKHYDELCPSGNSSTTNCEQQIFLELNGRKFLGTKSESISQPDKSGSATIKFHLLYQNDKDNNNTEAWADLLGNPQLGSFWSRSTKIRIISVNNGALIAAPPSDGSTPEFKVVRLNASYVVSWIVGLAVVLSALRISFGKNISSLIREDNPQRPAPFSLSRCQMLWWFICIIFSYVFIYMVTGNKESLNTSTGILMGIGTSTTLSAIFIDKPNPAPLTNPVTPTDPTPPTNPAPFPLSKGLLTDVLSSTKGSGPKLLRLQLVIWTFIMTVGFIVHVWNRLEMPQLSESLLLLQGIASGGYIVGKTMENIAVSARMKSIK